MYLCICGITVKGQPLSKHVIYREVPAVKSVMGERVQATRKEIAREIPVCQSCLSAINNGVPLDKLQRDGERKRYLEKEVKKALRRANRNAATPIPTSNLTNNVATNTSSTTTNTSKGANRPIKSKKFSGPRLKYKDLKNKKEDSDA